MQIQMNRGNINDKCSFWICYFYGWQWEVERTNEHDYSRFCPERTPLVMVIIHIERKSHMWDLMDCSMKTQERLEKLFDLWAIYMRYHRWRCWLPGSNQCEGLANIPAQWTPYYCNVITPSDAWIDKPTTISDDNCPLVFLYERSISSITFTKKRYKNKYRSFDFQDLKDGFITSHGVRCTQYKGNLLVKLEGKHKKWRYFVDKFDANSAHYTQLTSTSIS